MEAVKEPPLHNTSIDDMKASVKIDEGGEDPVVSTQTDVCHKSNGVAESVEPGDNTMESSTALLQDDSGTASSEVVDSVGMSATEVTAVPSVSNETSIPSIEHVEEELQENSSSGEPTVKAEITDIIVDDIGSTVTVQEVLVEESAVNDNITESSTTDRVTFQTEVLIETNANDPGENILEETKVNDQDTVNILGELRHNIELNEALRSSDVADNVENNNCTVRQEVFNKEELIDILEGNSEDTAKNIIPEELHNLPADKILETQIALKQLSRLKTKPNKKPRHVERIPKKRKCEKSVTQQETVQSPVVSKEKSIVKVLVQEWEDDEPAEDEQTTKLLEDSENLLKNTNELMETQESVTNQEEVSERTSVDSAITDDKNPTFNKTSDENLPQRRLGRVIKKKIIYDPDNPDTFTKSKSVPKVKELGTEKDQIPIKKIKSELPVQRSGSKSPISKLQWKKPSPKNCKQNKRLTEIDRLLMDEGAVNMICQLTPEAPKGKKNMKTKAEFIKRIQSSTPDTKEMKFRERKKDSKYEEGEAKRILGGKQRSSLSSSVKSPSVSEDFEAHSADDSIIYRRHSSSSYSSSCMSPRRLSDVEVAGHTNTLNSQAQGIQSQASNEGGNDRPSVDVFMSDSKDSIKANTINRDDCLSIKEKLNSKLNLALNKRKRENLKSDKPPKIKKIIKAEDMTGVECKELKLLSVIFDDKLAEICIRKSGSKNIEVVKELEKVLTFVASKKDISVTLITSECGTLCSDLDLRSLINSDVEKRANHAYDTAESIRCLLQAMQHHSKLLCAGVSGRCSGVGLAMVGLCDVTLASDRASFSISQKSHTGTAAVVPGIAVFSAYHLLSQSLLNDLVVFGRRLSASEALQGGLVSRTLWPERFYEQVRAIAKDITTQSMQNILLKKQLLNLKKSGSESTFLSCLEKERDLLVEYWSSVEGQELLRTVYNTS